MYILHHNVRDQAKVPYNTRINHVIIIIIIIIQSLGQYENLASNINDFFIFMKIFQYIIIIIIIIRRKMTWHYTRQSVQSRFKRYNF